MLTKPLTPPPTRSGNPMHKTDRHDSRLRDIRAFIAGVDDGNLHAKRLDSLAGATSA